MTKIRVVSIGIAAAALVFLTANPGIAHGAERGSAKATINGAHITIDYGRPVLRGRDMLGQLKPGQVWRIGADSPTTLESDKDLNFGGTVVPKGKHILLAKLVEPGKWTLVFSNKSVFEYEESAKIAEVPLAFEDASTSDEMVTIKLTEEGGAGMIEIAWGKMRLTSSFKPA